MAGTLIIDGLMGFFGLVTLGAAAAPLLLLPGWMAGVKARRLDFHRSAIAAIDAELARPQPYPGQAERLATQRQCHVRALLSLAPNEMIAPTAWPDGAGLRIAA